MSAVFAWCFAPKTLDFVISRSILTWCPHTFLQNCHWRMIAVQVVSALCFAFKGVTFYLRGDFSHLRCQHAGVWLYAPRGDLTRRPSTKQTLVIHWKRAGSAGPLWVPSCWETTIWYHLSNVQKNGPCFFVGDEMSYPVMWGLFHKPWNKDTY